MPRFLQGPLLGSGSPELDSPELGSPGSPELGSPGSPELDSEWASPFDPCSDQVDPVDQADQAQTGAIQSFGPQDMLGASWPQVDPATMLAAWGSGGITVPRTQDGVTGSAQTDTFVIATPTTVKIYAYATGPSDNRSDWSVILMRSTWFGADEAVGSRHVGQASGEIKYDQSVPQSWSASYYLLFRNASHYNSIQVAWNVS
jgi:hypothetical protein